MSKHTVELRWVIRNAETAAHGSYGEFSYTDATWRALGLDSYPIYDESHRAELNARICDHFYMREIGAETVPLFRLYLRRTMNEIMPYYNELYKMAAMIKDPLNEVDMSYTEGWGESGEERTSNTTNERGTETSHESTSRDTTTGSTEDVTSSSSSMYSDTPMSMVQDDGGTLLESGQYATNTTFDKSNTHTMNDSDTHDTGTTDRNSNDTRDTDASGKRDTSTSGSRERTERGHRKSQAELIMEWRKAILNVDRMILEDRELNDCFMLAY